MSQTLIKRPSETRTYVMDFSALMASGETLSAVNSVTATPAGLTLSGSPSAQGVFAQQTIAGGTTGVRYRLVYVVTTSLGNVLEADGTLAVVASS